MLEYLEYLRSQGLEDAAHVNNAAANYPDDLLQDHGLIEVKAVLVSNSKGKMYWAATDVSAGAKQRRGWVRRARPTGAPSTMKNGRPFSNGSSSPGFHLYVGFNSQQPRDDYVGSVKYK